MEYKNRQNEMEKEWRHKRNMAYVNDKKETKDMKRKEDKENLNEELIESVKTGVDLGLLTLVVA